MLAATLTSDRRRLVATVDLARVAVLAALVTAVALDAASLPLVYVVAFTCGVGETLRDTAASTLVPALVAPADYDRANGRLVNAEVGGNELVGPPLGGYLFGVAMVLPFAVNGATFTLTDSAWFAVLVLYTTEVLALPAAGYGVLLAVGAVGGLAGGFAAAAVLRRAGSAVALVGSLLTAAAAQAALGLTAHPVVAGAALAASSLAFGVWNVGAVTLRQRLTPAPLLGRVTDVYRTAAMGAVPLGALLGGLLAAWAGLRAPLLAGVPVLLAAAVLGAVVLRR